MASCSICKTAWARCSSCGKREAFFSFRLSIATGLGRVFTKNPNLAMDSELNRMLYGWRWIKEGRSSFKWWTLHPANSNVLQAVTGTKHSSTWNSFFEHPAVGFIMIGAQVRTNDIQQCMHSKKQKYVTAYYQCFIGFVPVVEAEWLKGIGQKHKNKCLQDIQIWF